MSITAVLAGLAVALKAVPKVRYYDDPGAVVDPPATVLGPPTLQWGAYDIEPSTATITISLVVPADDRALPRLLSLLPAVTAAIESVPDAAVRTAAPGTLQIEAGSSLPAYLIEIEVAL